MLQQELLSIDVITSTKEVMFLPALVCLSICLLATLQNLLTDFDEIFRKGQK